MGETELKYVFGGNRVNLRGVFSLAGVPRGGVKFRKAPPPLPKQSPVWVESQVSREHSLIMRGEAELEDGDRTTHMYLT